MKKIIKNIIFSNNLLFKLYCRYFWYPRNGSIEYFFMKYAKYKPFFIQVGANDGKVADPFYRFVKGFQWEGIFVEPQKYVFEEKLLSNYKKDKNIIFENSAIYKETISKFLYKISFSDSRWATGLSTFYEEQLKKSISSGYVERKANEFNEKLPQKLDEYITAEKVNCITFDDLLSRYKIKNVDIIGIDVEGHDHEIIKLINFKKINPKIIAFEHKHLNENNYNSIVSFLNLKGYKIIKDNFDSIALKEFL